MKLIEHGKTEEWQLGAWIQNDYDDERRNSFALYLGRHCWWFRLKNQLIAPIENFVDTSHYEWAKPGPDGRCGYTELTRRKYGVKIMKDSFHAYFGADTDSWPNPHQIYYRFPWMELRRIHVDYLDSSNNLVIRYQDKANGAIDFDGLDVARSLVPKTRFKFLDYDKETEVIATVYQTESVYRRGDKWAKFLNHLLPKKVYRHIHVNYDKETGPERASWKGGTTATTFPLNDGETMFDGFRRLAKDENFSNIQVIKPT